jgi:hypothetical protein
MHSGFCKTVVKMAASVVKNDCIHFQKSLHSFLKITALIFENDCAHFFDAPIGQRHALTQTHKPLFYIKNTK